MEVATVKRKRWQTSDARNFDSRYYGRSSSNRCAEAVSTLADKTSSAVMTEATIGGRCTAKRADCRVDAWDDVGWRAQPHSMIQNANLFVIDVLGVWRWLSRAEKAPAEFRLPRSQPIRSKISRYLSLLVLPRRARPPPAAGPASSAPP